MEKDSKNFKAAIFIMGGGLVNESGIWRTTNYDEGDNFGVSGDRAIVEATGLLYKEEPEVILILLGGKGQYKEIADAPYVSAVIKKELMELGVPAQNIIEETNSVNTFQQLKNLQEILRRNPFGKVSVISNRHSLPRIQAMIEYKDELEKLKEVFDISRLTLVSAEEILLDRQPDIWRNIIEDVYTNEAMKKRIALEEQGVRQIKDGTYKFI